MLNRQVQFVIFLFLVLCALILPDLIKDGMFMDGMIYATVSKNLANGMGSYWDLHLTDAWLNHYRHQPPLTFWITSFFFKIIGNNMYTERIYSFCTSIIAILLIRAVWKSFYRNDQAKTKLWWFPALLYISIPIVSWSYRNNMQENTMVIFILASAYFFLKCLRAESNCIRNNIAAVIFIFLAFMCKGIQGMFTLLMPIFYFIIYRKRTLLFYINRMIPAFLVLIILFACLYFYLPARQFLIEYFQERIEKSFTFSYTATTTTRWYMLYRLVCELLIPFGLILIILVVNRFNKNRFETTSKDTHRKAAFFFLLIGFSGALPLMITLEQRGFYLISAFPFIVMSIASFFIPAITNVIYSLKINPRHFLTFNLTGFAIVIAFTIFNSNKIRRNSKLLEDVHKIGKILPAGIHLPVPDNQFDNWSLQLYLKRYYNIDVVPTMKLAENNPDLFYLSVKNDSADIFSQFKQLPVGYLNFFVLRKK